MKKVLILVLLLPLFACEEEIAKGDSLTAQERAYLRQRAAAKCMDEGRQGYNNFKTNSTQTVFQSNAFVRGKAFTHNYKNSTATRIVNIKVWKQDRATNSIYLYVTEKLINEESYFLKITEVDNDLFIDDILKDTCDKFYTTTGGSSGPSTVLYEFENVVGLNTVYYDDRYLLSSKYPAFFARFHKSRTKETKKTSTNVRVGALENATSTFKAAANYTFPSNVYTSTDYTQNFCIPEEEIPSKHRFSQDISASTAAEDQALKMDCNTVKPGDWNLTISP